MTDSEINDIDANKWVTISPNGKEADNLAKTLLMRQDQLAGNFTQFANRDLYSYKFNVQDPVLGTGWGLGFRSPVYDITEIVARQSANDPIAVPIKYFSRDLKGGEVQVQLFDKANKFKGDPSIQMDINNVRRLDDFVLNVAEIAKIQLKKDDDVYLLTYDQVPLIKTTDIATSNQCQYLKLMLTIEKYDPATHLVSKSNVSNRCSYGLWTGPLYKKAVDEMLAIIKTTPANTSVSQPIFGGARKSRRHRVVQNPFSLTKHNRHRYTKNNHRRKRYNVTKKGGAI